MARSRVALRKLLGIDDVYPSVPQLALQLLHTQAAIAALKMAASRSMMRLGTGRSLASATRSANCRAFSSTPLQQVAKVTAAGTETPNLRQADRPRTLDTIPNQLSHGTLDERTDYL